MYPGLVVQMSMVLALAAPVAVLAQGTPALAAVEPSIDDIYYPFLFGSQFDLLDLDHVEVLRGPQGTLFGRNSIAGAVNMVSRKPSLTEATASLDVTLGAYDRRDLRASFSVPLNDTLAVGASMVSKQRTGYQQMIDFTCQMFMNGTPELAGTFPFQSPETTFGGGRTPFRDVVGGRKHARVPGDAAEGVGARIVHLADDELPVAPFRRRDARLP